MLTSTPVGFDAAQLAVQATSDPDAFARLYDCYFPRIFTYARYRCADDATADDLTAAIFERLLTRIGRYHPARGPFEPWLFALARNVANDHWRKKQRTPWLSLERFHSIPAPEPDPEEIVLALENEGELLAALERLELRERDLLGLKFAAQLSHRQIAAFTGLSESNIAVIVHRALEKLRQQLAQKQL